MSWFRVDDKSAFHAKVVAAGNSAWGALCRMGAHSSAHGKDGFVPESVAKLIDTGDDVRNLLAVGFLDEVAGGYQIHDFLEWNPSAATLEQLKRKRSRAGKQGGSKSAARYRASAATHGQAGALASVKQVLEQNSSKSEAKLKQRVWDPLLSPDLDLSEQKIQDGSGMSTVASEPSSEVRLAVAPVRTLNATADRAGGLAVAAWADGMGSVTGKPFTVPRFGAELSKLIDAMIAHCPDDSERCEWAHEAGVAYATARAGETLSTHRFVDWLNSGRPAKASGPRGVRSHKQPDGDWTMPKAVNADDDEGKNR